MLSPFASGRGGIGISQSSLETGGATFGTPPMEESSVASVRGGGSSMAATRKAKHIVYDC